MNNRGQALVQILIFLISISVIATALNMNFTSNRSFYTQDTPSLLSSRAKGIFDELSYHLKIAGYGQNDSSKSVEIRKGDMSDTLIIRYKNVETVFYVNVDNNQSKGVLYKSIGGVPRELAGSVQRLRFGQLTAKILETEITLDLEQSDGRGGIVMRSFSTALKIGYN
jgi:hypothetical protein